MPMTPLPPAPTRLDPVNFSAKGDALMTALPNMVTEANAMQADVTTKQGLAAGSAAAAAISAQSASDSAASAAAIVGATKWNAATSYTIGNVAWSLINGLAYRNKLGGVDATDPASSPSRWYPLSVLPDMTGKAGRTLKTLDGVTASWVATYGAVGELRDFPLPPDGVTPNTITTSTGDVFLKTGITVTREDALLASYDVATLEAYGMCTPKTGSGIADNKQFAFGVGTSGGKFVRVANGGVIQYSSDGLNFTTATSGTTSDIQVVRFLNNQFVAAGTTWIGTSADGIVWSAKSSPYSQTKNSIDYVGGVYVLTSNAVEYARWTTDLINWNLITTVNFQNPPPNIAFGNNVFVFSDGYGICTLPSDGSGALKRVYTESDGLSNHSYHFLYAGGRFMALSRTTATGLTSVDGVTWTPFTTPAVIITTLTQGQSAIGYINARFVANFQSGVSYYTANNGTTWTATTGASLASTVCMKVVGNRVFAFSGNNASVSGLYYSLDGMAFTAATGLTGLIFDVEYNATNYVAVGAPAGLTNGNIWVSADGAAFTSSYTPGSPVYSIAWGNGSYVVGLNNGVNQLLASTTGLASSWVTPSVPLMTGSVQTVKYLNSTFIVSTTSPEVWFATVYNGTWTKSTGTFNSVATAAYANGKYYLFTYQAYAESISLSSFNWGPSTAYFDPTTSSSIGAYLASDGTRMLMVAPSSGSVYSSGDGKVWGRYSDYTTTAPLLSIRYVKDRFIITTGQVGVPPRYLTGPQWVFFAPGSSTWGETAWNGTLWMLNTLTSGVSKSWTSTDFVTWVPHYGVNAIPYGLTLVYGNGVFVGTTGSGSFVTPDGATGRIGYPLSVTAPTNATTYIKVK